LKDQSGFIVSTKQWKRREVQELLDPEDEGIVVL
jgi:hypothetical protein